MFKVLDCIANQHNVWLVAVAAFLCWFAMRTMVFLWRRSVIENVSHTSRWLVAAALTMGSGVWVTLFVAILAYRFPWAIGYDAGLTVFRRSSPWELSASPCGSAGTFIMRLAAPY